MPPEPVRAVSVSGSAWPSPTKRFSELSPSGGSTSITITPDTEPVAIATFALGHLRHQASTVPASLLACFTPWLVSGCLPGLAQSVAPQPQRPLATALTGNTAQPLAA